MHCTRVLVFLGCLSALTAAQSAYGEDAPLPTQLTAARKVFVSNAGEDPTFDFKPGSSYSSLYTRLKDWKY